MPEAPSADTTFAAAATAAPILRSARSVKTRASALPARSTRSARPLCERAWGRADESWNSMAALSELGGETWFKLNSEAPWPHLEALERITAKTGKQLVQRLAIYPAYAQQPEHWLHHGLRAPVLRLIDAEGFPRIDDWSPGQESIVPADEIRWLATPAVALSETLQRVLRKARSGTALAAQSSAFSTNRQ